MTMTRLREKQQGGGLLTIIVLALLAYAAYVGIQYVPIKIEFSAVDTILESIGNSHKTEPAYSVREVRAKIDSQLFVNQKQDLLEAFEVTQYRGKFIVSVKLERDLNLLFESTKLVHENSITLN